MNYSSKLISFLICVLLFTSCYGRQERLMAGSEENKRNTLGMLEQGALVPRHDTSDLELIDDGAYLTYAHLVYTIYLVVQELDGSSAILPFKIILSPSINKDGDRMSQVFLGATSDGFLMPHDYFNIYGTLSVQEDEKGALFELKGELIPKDKPLELHIPENSEDENNVEKPSMIKVTSQESHEFKMVFNIARKNNGAFSTNAFSSECTMPDRIVINNMLLPNDVYNLYFTTKKFNLHTRESYKKLKNN